MILFYLLPIAVAAFAILVGYKLTLAGMSLLGLPVLSMGLAIPLLIIVVHQYNAEEVQYERL